MNVVADRHTARMRVRSPRKTSQISVGVPENLSFASEGRSGIVVLFVFSSPRF
jgi:hypothetical protein